MIWNICFVISIAIIIITIFQAWAVMKKYKSGRIITPVNVIIAGVFLAMIVGMIPIIATILADESNSIFKLLMLDIFQTIQVFTIDAGTDLITDNINRSTTAIGGIYSTYMSILFVIAPILTFTFLISLFKNVVADFRYKLHYRKDVYAFSQLNEKSLILARSIKAKYKNALIVFTNVDREESGILTEHIESAKELNAIIFKKDIVSVNIMKHSSKSKIFFFAIAEKESENLISSLKLLEKYNSRKNTRIYVFSTSAEGELLLANAFKGEVKVRRVNEVRSLIYRFLYDEGERIFESAKMNQDGCKEINAIVVGLGQYGSEMLKALTWYSQMDGYSIDIHAFDQDVLAEEIFSAHAPELMSEKHNGVHIPGDSEYSIHIHSGIDVRTKTFADYITKLTKTTFVFVCLGNDADNINQAANIRMLCARAGCTPIIKTIVYSVDEKEALEGITNYRGQKYGIEAIGDFESAYSQEILIGSELENLALKSHLKWGDEEEFWQYEYNYRSSMASAIHKKARIACGIPGADKAEAQLSKEERDIIERLEHRRWNTYMRCEGYVYSGSLDKSSRNDLAKMHHNLVDYKLLNEEDKRKDSKVGTN